MATKAEASNPASNAGTLPAEASNVAGLNGQQPQQGMPQVKLAQVGGNLALQPATVQDNRSLQPLMVPTDSATSRKVEAALSPRSGVLPGQTSFSALAASNLSHQQTALRLRPRADSPTSPLNHAGLTLSLPQRPLAVRKSPSDPDSPTDASSPLALRPDTDFKRNGNGRDVDAGYAEKAAKRANLTRMLSTLPSSKEAEDTSIFDYPLRLAAVHTDLGRDVAIGTAGGSIQGAVKFYYDWIRPKKLTDHPLSIELIKSRLPQSRHLNSFCKNFCKIVSRTLGTIALLADRTAIAVARVVPFVLGFLGGAGPFGLWILNALTALTRVVMSPVAFLTILGLALIVGALALTGFLVFYVGLYLFVGRGILEHVLYKGLLKFVIIGGLTKIARSRCFGDSDYNEQTAYTLYKMHGKVSAMPGEQIPELNLRTLKYALAHAQNNGFAEDVVELADAVYAKDPGCCAKTGTCARNCCGPLYVGRGSQATRVLGPQRQVMGGSEPNTSASMAALDDHHSADPIATLDLSSGRGQPVVSAHAAHKPESKASEAAV